MHAGGDVYLPACFPPESLENDTKPPPLVISDEERSEVCLHARVSRLVFTYLQLHSLLVYAYFSSPYEPGVEGFLQPR